MKLLAGLLISGILILFPPKAEIPVEQLPQTANQTITFEERLERYRAKSEKPELCRSECREWALNTGLVEENSEQFRIMQCESYPSLEPTACNKEYGCGSGMGLWGFTAKTWNETLSKMSKANVWMPERCWQLLFSPINIKKTESVFDVECNLIVGLFLYEKDGNQHWGSEETNWGSFNCWNKSLGDLK